MQWQGLHLHNDICEVHRRVTVYAYFLQYTSLYPKVCILWQKINSCKKDFDFFQLSNEYHVSNVENTQDINYVLAVAALISFLTSSPNIKILNTEGEFSSIHFPLVFWLWSLMAIFNGCSNKAEQKINGINLSARVLS